VSTQLVCDIRASQIARELGLPLVGEDAPVIGVCPLSSLNDQRLTFSKAGRIPPTDKQVTVIGSPELATPNVSVLTSQNPRLDFVRALDFLDTEVGFYKEGEPAQVHPTARVGAQCVVGTDVEIGSGTILGDNVLIHDETIIGNDCVIKSGAIIGQAGFGFERDAEGRPIRMVHLGRVRIGDHVEIGSLTTVCRGALADTVVGAYSKIDDHVHVAHNCTIRENVIITAGVVLSGSVEVGRAAWIAPGSCVRNKVKIGPEAFIGIGSIVCHDVEPQSKVFGNPASRIG